MLFRSEISIDIDIETSSMEIETSNYNDIVILSDTNAIYKGDVICIDDINNDSA